MVQESAATQTKGGEGARLVGPSLVLATLVGSVVSSFGAPLIPAIAETFAAPLGTAQWSLTAALIVGTVASPVLGRLGDGRHRRAVLLIGLIVVVAGGIVSATASTLEVLIVGRSLQGLGLALAPLTMAIARSTLPTNRVAPMIAVLSVSSAAGLGAGYPLSGWLDDVWGLSGAYWFGAVVAVAALICVLCFVPAGTSQASATRFDWTGTALLGSGLVCLLVTVAQGNAWGWLSPAVMGLLAAGILVIVAWVLYQLRSPHPLVQLRTLRHPSVLVGDVCALVLGTAMYMVLTSTTAFVQTPQSRGFGFSSTALVAGLVLVPLSVLMFAASRILPGLLKQFGARLVLVSGCLIAASGCAFFALFNDWLWEAFVMSSLIGIGLGLTFAAIPGMISRAVPKQETGSAVGFYQVLRFTGFALGTALTSALLAQMSDGAGRPTEVAYVSVMWVAAGLCLFAGVLVRWGMAARATVE